MRPLHGLILLLALVALLVGGLFWLGKSGSAGTIDPARAETPALPAAPAAELTSTETDAAHPERAAQPGALVKVEGADAAMDSSKGLFGRVVGADGKGVPGAKVYAAPADGPAFMPLDALDPKTMPWAKRSDAVTDAEGRFALALSDQTHVRLAVRAGGFAPLDTERTLARGGRDLGDVALEPGVVLEGKVVDQLGRAVAEAQLFSRPRNAGFGIEMMGRGRNPLATTDAEGHFRIDILASGPWRMLVSSEDHPDKTFDGESERPGAVTRNLQFALDEGAQIAGRVTGAGAEVLATLQVSAQPRAENEEGGGEGLFFGPGGFTLPRKAKLGADGSFLLRGLKPGQNYKLEAQRAETGFYGFAPNSRNGVNAKSGDRGIEVPYTPSAAIVCQVVDAASGKPVTEMDVKAGYGWMMPLMDADGKAKSSFPDGNVRFDRLPPRFGGGGSGLKLRIDATGYKSFESASLTPVQGQDIDLGVVRLERAPVCRVQVLDLATGQPLAGAEVSLREDSGEGQPGFGRSVSVRRAGGGGRTVNEEGSSQGTTGADGSVVLSSFPGKKATLRVKHADYATFKNTLTLAESSDQQETVKLARGGEVLVSVRDAQDRPVPGVEIEHAGPGGEEGNAFEMRFSGSNLRSDARGELVFSHLEAGTHRFRVATDGGGMRMFGGGGAVQATFVLDGTSTSAEPPQEEPWANVEVQEGAAAPLKLVAPMRGSLVGRVREGGKPLAGASVRLEEKKENAGGFMGMPFFGGGDGPRTNGSGEYKCEGVKPGKYTIHLTHPSRAMPWEADLEVGEGEQRYDIDLPIAIVEGRITGPDGKPVVGARISAERKQEKSESHEMVFSFAVAGDDGDAMTFGGSGGGEAQRTDADGRYTLRGLLTDADLVVHVTHKDYKPTNSEKFRCAPDQTVRGIDVKLSQGGILEVRVVRGGKPVSGVLVNAYHKAKDGTDENQQTEFSGPAGVARFSGLEPGDWEFDVVDVAAAGELGTPPPEGPRQQVKLAAGVTTKVDHELP